ncbi:hypothetical protein ACFQU7_02495 [Pseudoroseomonas wenyumeiae]
MPGLARLSAERVWMELKRLLEAPDPGGALALMREAGVLPAVLPEAGRVPPCPACWPTRRPRWNPCCGWRLCWRPAPKPMPWPAACAFPRPRRNGCGNWRTLLRPPPELDGAALRRWLAGTPPGLPADLAWIAEASDGVDRSALRGRVAATPRPVFPLQGRDALAAGIPAGPGWGRPWRGCGNGGCKRAAHRMRRPAA